MKTLRELHAALKNVQQHAATDRSTTTLYAGDVVVAGALLEDVIVAIADAIATGGDRPTPAMTVEQRLTRLERGHFDDDGWEDRPWEELARSVSEGAQRDAADLHKRVTALEKRLLPPNAESSWTLLTTPEITTAIERLETDLANMRKGDADREYDRRRMLESIQGAEKMAEVAQERARAIEIELRGMRKSITQLQAQWNNIRNRLKALLSSES